MDQIMVKGIQATVYAARQGKFGNGLDAMILAVHTDYLEASAGKPAKVQWALLEEFRLKLIAMQPLLTPDDEEARWEALTKIGAKLPPDILEAVLDSLIPAQRVNPEEYAQVRQWDADRKRQLRQKGGKPSALLPKLPS